MTKKLLTLVVVVILGWFGFLWYLGGESLVEKERSSNLEDLGLVKIERRYQPDSDSDGLKDWEELFWQTDPQNKDTDQDGTPDGQEVDQGRNPTIRASDDTLVDQDYKAAALVRQAVKEKGAPLFDPGTQPSALWLPVLRFRSADIRISTLENKVAFRRYGQNLAGALAVYTKPLAESELVLTLKILESDDRLALSQLQQLVNRHVAVIQELKEVVVPESAAELHLTLLNTIGGLAEAGINMSAVLKEPVLALESAQLYPARFALLLNIFDGLNQYFVERQVIFDDQERITVNMFLLSQK